jgi:adhesin transport system outer membrane protein
VENLAPLRRNDVIGSVDQLLTDFGATSARIRAGNATNDAARADLDAARNTSLLQLVATWYDVLSAQTATALAQSNVDRMRVLADGAALRFERGVDSGGDVARARAYLAAAQSQKVGLDRRLRTAEARFVELFGASPGTLHRPEAVAGTQGEGTAVRPELVAARAQERAAAAALAAAKSDRLPRIEGRISGAAYDVLRGSEPAYDVRAQLTLRQRFSAGGAEAARVAELAARRRAASLAVERIAAATTREAGVAQADVDSLAAAMPPLEAAYLDSRRARDLFAEQFRVARGTLFDVLRAEQDLLDTALALAQASYDLDVARFTLLARNGGLIERFGLTPAAVSAGLEPRP